MFAVCALSSGIVGSLIGSLSPDGELLVLCDVMDDCFRIRVALL